MSCWRKFFILFIAFLVICVLAFFLVREQKKEWARGHEYIRQTFSGIEFEGRIDTIHEVQQLPGALVHGIACLELDSTSVDTYYIYDRLAALKIENGVAAVPIGFLGYELNKQDYSVIVNSKYLKVNRGGNRKIIFTDSLGNQDERGLLLRSAGIREEHLQLCFN